MIRKKLLFISLADLARTPYGDIGPALLGDEHWDITIVAPNASRSLLRTVVPYKCNAIDLPSGRITRELLLQRFLLTARFNGYDVLYVHSQAAGTRAALGAHLAKTVIYHNPDYYDPIAYPVQTALEGMLCRAASLHINNEFHRGYICRAQYRMKCPVITVPPNLPSGWPIPAVASTRRQEIAPNPDDFVLMLHGGYSPLRMVPELLRALSLLPKRFRLVMTQNASGKDAAEEDVRMLGLRERVHIVAAPLFADMLTYTVAADAGVLLYRNNDLGNFFTAPGRLTEYLACSLPVLASKFTGIENLVRRHGVGVCVDSRDPRRIATGLEELEQWVRSDRNVGSRCRDVFLAKMAVDHWRGLIRRQFEELGTPPRDAEPPCPWEPGTNICETSALWRRDG